MTHANAGGARPGRNLLDYIDDAAMVAENQESPHVILRPYPDVLAALAGGEDSPLALSLDGAWSFCYATSVDRVPDGFYAEGFDVSAWDQLQVPHVWQQDGYDSPVYRNVASVVAPYDPPRVPRDLNPTGAYVRSFEVPAAWGKRRHFLRFEGVTSGYFVWLNGSYVGYDSGGYTPAEFDVTDLLRIGRNTLAVQVHRFSAGSYLENMDMWHLSGIFRTVWLYTTPQVWVRDLAVTTDLDQQYRDAQLAVTIHIAGLAETDAGTHALRAMLFDRAGERVCELGSEIDAVNGGERRLVRRVADPAKWSDETPYLYRLVVELLDESEVVTHVVAQDVGFRKIEVIDRQIHVNGVPVDLRGVNRHEHDPRYGRAVPFERMRQDVLLMKRHNINAVRVSHYPNDPRWYELADRYGIWLCDEVDVETHFRSSADNCLADRPEWQAAMLDRFVGMVERDKNHPSVLMWSTGNEAGLGAAHFAMADYARRRDPTRLLYHQDARNGNNGDAPYADVWGPRYPSPKELVDIAARTDRPVVMGEWLHVLGNGLGHYEDMWQIIRREPALQGGFVWEWVGHELERPLVTTPDRSGNGITAYLSGNPEVVKGRDGGQALYLSGLDDWVEVYRDRRLDLSGEALTLDAWVRPGAWTGDFTIVSKGEQYLLQMRDAEAVEFGVDAGGPCTVAAPVPADWYGTWHRVTGVYDGVGLRLYIDGRQVSEEQVSGAIGWSHHPVAIGRNAARHTHNWPGRTAHGTIDSVRIYAVPLRPEQIASGADPYEQAVLALDFDEFDDRGSYASYGSSPFLVDALVAADRTGWPALAQLAYSHAWIRFAALDAASGRIRVTNDYRFTDTSAIELRWRLTSGEAMIAEGSLQPVLAPGSSVDIELPVPPPEPGSGERWLTLQAVLRQAITPWAEAGHVLASEQFPAGGRFSPVAPPVPTGRPVELRTGTDAMVVSGRDFEYAFGAVDGTLTSMRAHGRELLVSGPRLDAWRSPLGNETAAPWAIGGAPVADQFWAVGLDRLETRSCTLDAGTTDTGAVRVTIHTFTAAPGSPDGFDHTMTYVIGADGSIRLRHRVEPVGERMRALPWLPMLGVQLRLPSIYDTFTWYGRGPIESYPDRKSAAHMGVWRGTVDEQFVDYLPPQDNGLKSDVRWASLTDADGFGLSVSGEFAISVSRYVDLERAAYPFLLSAQDHITIHIAHAVTGLGDTANLVLPRYRVAADRVSEYEIHLRPHQPHQSAAGRGQVLEPEVGIRHA